MQQALTDEELNQLSEFLETTGPSALNLEAIEGLFCALICVPEPVHPDQVLSLICGKGFVFDNEQEVDRILGLLVRHWNTVESNLRSILSDAGTFIEKFSEVWWGNDWARGFMLAAVKRRKFWDELMKSEETGVLLVPMLRLGNGMFPDPKDRPPLISPEEQEFGVRLMFSNLTKIYLHFEPLRRSRPSGLQLFAPAQSGTRVSLGPNGDCPCGSGKQYEQCCSSRMLTVH